MSNNIKAILESVANFGAMTEQEQKAHGSEPTDVTTQGQWNDTEQKKRPLDKSGNKEAIDTSKGENAPDVTNDDDDKEESAPVFKGKGTTKNSDTGPKTSSDITKAANIKEAAGAIKLDMDAMRNLLEAQSEDASFVAEALEIFEATMHSALDIQANKMAKAAGDLVVEAIETELEIMEAQIEDYLNVAILEWAEDNRLAIQEGVRTTVAESFMSDLVELFEGYNVKLPAESIDLYEQSLKIGEQVLEEKEALEVELTEARAEIDTVKKALVVEAFIQDNNLPLAEAERVRGIAKQIGFKSVDDFEGKLNTIAESYSQSGRNTLNESTHRSTQAKQRNLNESVDSDGLNITESVNEYADPTVAALAAGFRA